MCDCDLVCAMKYVVTFSGNCFFVLCYVNSFIAMTNPFCEHALSDILFVKFLFTCKFVIGCGNGNLYILWGKIEVSSRSFLALTINHVLIFNIFSCGGLTLRSCLYIWKVVEKSRVCRRLGQLHRKIAYL